MRLKLSIKLFLIVFLTSSIKIHHYINPKIEVVFVQGGSFTMGCTREQSNCSENERPAHKVTLNDFYIGKYEVTQAQWIAVMGENPSHFSGCSDCPVENINWQDANTFCKKLNRITGKKYQLPTEAQWEYTARGGKKSEGNIYSGSDEINDVSWYNGNSKQPQKVGTKVANELGVYDMSGNIWEWCLDIYDENFYTKSPENNPEGPLDANNFVVLRGGSCFDNSESCRVSKRTYSNRSRRLQDRGLRVVLIP
jgi:formylglycine-generating enzyme required for sulfatase activity